MASTSGKGKSPADKSVKFQAPKVGRQAPALPTSGNVSWFQAIKGRKAGEEGITFKGPGVPVNENVSKNQNHGYWIQRSRTTPGGKKLAPLYYFYYTGTGPRDQAKYGQEIPYVTWVKGDGAKTSQLSEAGSRDVNKFPNAFPLIFPTGDGPERGFFIERSRSRSRSNSQADNRSKSRERSQSSDKPRKEDRGRSKSPAQKNPGSGGKITKEKAALMVSRAYSKRTLPPNKPVDQVFGSRDTEKNFGDAEMIKKGMSDPRFTAALIPTPGPQAALFGSHVTLKEKPDGLEITYKYRTLFPKTDERYEEVKHAYLSNVPLQDGGQPLHSSGVQKKLKSRSKSRDRTDDGVENPTTVNLDWSSEPVEGFLDDGTGDLEWSEA
ncbi:N protein [Bottlenose dolphin coronavirus]|nr:N protein [Bottlenose dolphin coronavirus]QII89045.1 N protein [Bottlenose dolphin coronavirus]QII89059.1 N protein [Bottlenose dolphin coronavirus]QII89073.1 N protein [Bottlenose dolphin coronavirus]